VKLNRRDLVRIFFRSFVIQGLWTVQRAQNLGYVYSLWPVFRRLHPKRDDRAHAARAHAGYFSTHPYTAGVLLGVVAGMEEDRSEGHGPSTETVLAARSAMSGPLAALGEIFFWGTWLPFSLVATLCLGMAGPGWVLGSSVVYLVLFNVPHLFVRAMGLWWGYRWKSEVVAHLAPLRIQSFLPGVAVLGIGLVLFWIGSVPLNGIPGPAGFLWVIFFWGVLRLGVRPSYVALGVAGASVVYSFVRELL
jgi:mannose/fructose/N-acetylgalactosamine-specific phosphotransferase system component IID